MDGIARGREDEFAAQLARGEIVALLQITHLMGGIGQLVSVNCDVSHQRVRGGRGSLDLAEWMFACKSTNKRHPGNQRNRTLKPIKPLLTYAGSSFSATLGKTSVHGFGHWSRP